MVQDDRILQAKYGFRTQVVEAIASILREVVKLKHLPNNDGITISCRPTIHLMSIFMNTRTLFLIMQTAPA